MIYNYHTHTVRCSHASGTPEEYVKRAIDGGIKFMGFSDHMPFICSNGVEARYRVPKEQAYEYVSELKLLREKFKDSIDIKIGFEMEYYPDNFNDMLTDALDFGAEYLILGPHFIHEESPDGFHTIKATDSEEFLEKYVSCVISAIKSGVFTYVAHPDIVNYTGDVEIYKKEMKKLCIESKKYNVPLEINFLGIRDNRNYPNELFWEIAGKVKAPVTFGFDAHDVMSAWDNESLLIANKMVEKYNLNYIGKPEIVLIQNIKK